MDVTIVIPVYNGKSRFRQVLEAIKSQKTDLSYEVVVVDSGSTDESVEVAKESGCIVKEIPNTEFGHGKTRNLGASLGSGKYIVFLTQDALPANENWLSNLVSVMESDEQIAGAFGRHLPYEDCNLPDQQMLFEHFARFEEEGVFSLTDENRSRYECDADYASFLAFFSDNCSILRRSVWEKIPYDDVDFAEDQVWARKILEAGYKKAYAKDALVYHSHNYPLKEYRKRYFDDFKAVYRVHHQNFCPNTATYIRRVLGDTKHNLKFILGKKNLSFMGKIKGAFYCFNRNRLRYKAARDAVEYFNCTDEKKHKLDEMYSQQHDMRK